MNQDSAEFNKWFEMLFGRPFPLELSDAMVLKESHVWCTTLNRLPLTQMFRPEIIPSNAEDFVMVGTWGYGSNSRAFYYISKKGPKQVFLRLPYGNHYGDSAKDEGAEVVESLEEFGKWSDANLSRFEWASIRCNMGDWEADVVYCDGTDQVIVHAADTSKLGRGLARGIRQAAMLVAVRGVEPPVYLHLSSRHLNGTIGRTRDATIHVDIDSSISRVHAGFEVTGEGFRLWDKKSTNGTIVNGKVVGVGPILIRAGEKFVLGRTTFRFFQGGPNLHSVA